MFKIEKKEYIIYKGDFFNIFKFVTKLTNLNI